MQLFRLSLICTVSWALFSLATAGGHHGGGLGGVGLLLGVGLLAKLLQDHGHHGHHHHHHVYVPIPVKHHQHHGGYGHGGYGYEGYSGYDGYY